MSKTTLNKPPHPFLGFDPEVVQKGVETFASQHFLVFTYDLSIDTNLSLKNLNTHTHRLFVNETLKTSSVQTRSNIKTTKNALNNVLFMYSDRYVNLIGH